MPGMTSTDGGLRRSRWHVQIGVLIDSRLVLNPERRIKRKGSIETTNKGRFQVSEELNKRRDCTDATFVGIR